MRCRILRDGVGERYYIIAPTDESEPKVIEYRMPVGPEDLPGYGGKVVDTIREADHDLGELLKAAMNLGYAFADGKPGPCRPDDPFVEYKERVAWKRARFSRRTGTGTVDVFAPKMKFPRFVRPGCDLPECEGLSVHPHFIGQIDEEAGEPRDPNFQRRFIVETGELFLKEHLDRALAHEAMKIRENVPRGEEPNWMDLLERTWVFPAADIADVFPLFVRAYRKQAGS